jgi:hypothetical protein
VDCAQELEQARRSADAGGGLGGQLVREAGSAAVWDCRGDDGQLAQGQAYEEEAMGTRQVEISNSVLWPSKQKLEFGALMRFQLPIHVHPNKKSVFTVYFHFLDDLVSWFNSIPKDTIHTTKQNLSQMPLWQL